MGEEGCPLEHHKGFDQFRGLNLDRPNHQPTARPIHGATHHQGGGHHQKANQQGHGGDVQPAAQAGAEAEPKQAPAGHHPNQLALEVVGGIAHLPFGNPPAGGGEHQDAHHAPEGHHAEHEAGLSGPKVPWQGQ